MIEVVLSSEGKSLLDLAPYISWLLKLQRASPSTSLDKNYKITIILSKKSEYFNSCKDITLPITNSCHTLFKFGLKLFLLAIIWYPFRKKGREVLGSKRIESLDSLRGVSAFVVVIFHCLTSYVIFLNANFGVFQTEAVKWFTISPLKLLWAGNEAVLLFFVLSGFVLSLPLFNGKDMRYSSYIVKRFFRIYMPFIVVMAISAVLATLFMGYKENGDLSAIYINRWDHDITLKAIVAYIFMINYDVSNVNGVVWSLFHEMRVSIIFPFIALVIYKFNFFKSFIIFAVTYAIAWYSFSTIETSTTYHPLALVSKDFLATVWYTIFFIAGSYLARYLYLFNFLKKSGWYVKLSLFILSILLINCKLLYVFDITNMKHQHLFSLFGILLLFIVVLNSTLADKILTLKPFLWLGKVSYSLYLIHIPVIMLTTIFLGKVIPMWAAFAIATVLSLPVAGLAYRWIEVPSINIGRRAAALVTRKKSAPSITEKQA